METASVAKGQMRSNRETRKPKQAKSPVKVETPLGSQVKAAQGSLQGATQKK
jgi:hypothetical protein